MKKNKIISIVGARPNFVKLHPIHSALTSIGIDHIIIHTGQHFDYEMSQVFFENLKLPNPDYNLNVGVGGHNFQLGQMLTKLEEILVKENPELVLVYGDTNSTLAGSLAANKLNFLVCHVEAGLRSFDRKMPEEINRILTDHISDTLFCPTKNAVKNLKREHVFGKSFLTGDVMAETLNDILQLKEKESEILNRLNIERKGYFLLTIHRSENTELRNLYKITQILKDTDKRIVFPIHPRTVKFLKQYMFFEDIMRNKNIRVTQPLSYPDFVFLEKNAQKILTDSGGIQKEAYLLGVPCITLRENTEWVETIDSGWNILVGVNSSKILSALEEFNPTSDRKPIFGRGKASLKIANILFNSYLS